MNRFSPSNLLWAAPLALLALGGCTRDYKFQPVDMWNLSRLRPMSQVNFFEDHRASREPPAGTVARGQDRLNEPQFYGTENGNLVAYNPLVRTARTPADHMAILQRGQERYQIYCQPCHGLAGYGDGTIVKRGFAVPPSYHIQRLRDAPDGHIYDVITNGYGVMYSYASRVTPRDRWAIVAYIRALQRSQHAAAADVPAGAVNGVPQPAVPEFDEIPAHPGFGVAPTPLPAPERLPLAAIESKPAAPPPNGGRTP